MPAVSEKQRKAMWAAAKGHSTLGIPESVGKEFVSKDEAAMTDQDWDCLRTGIIKWLTEEQEEPAHDPAQDEWREDIFGIAMDKGSVRSYDTDGRLRIERAHISKANVCPYLGSEIPGYEPLGLDPNQTYQLLRHPDELAKAVPSFASVPILSRHVPVSAADHQPALVIGSTGSDVEFNDPYLDVSLTFWAQEAIDDIENEVKRELSSAYRYRPDMTPGTFKGVPYDGVMRDIIGNHVAHVKEGRAGADVVVGDSKPSQEQQTMKVLSRKATVARGALMAFLMPRLAQDKKFDPTPLLIGVSGKNFKDKKPSIIEGVRTGTRGLLAKDASLDDMTRLMDSLENEEVMEGVDADPTSGLPMEKLPGPAMKPKGIDAAMEFLKGKGASDADIEEAKRLAGDEDEETEEEKKKKKEAEDARAAEDRRAHDADKDEDKVTKSAMDAAIAATAASVLKTQRDIRDAEKTVRPYVGELTMSFDSAEAVYRHALTALNVDVKGVHESALKTILNLQPKPGEKKPSERLGQDAAITLGSAADFNKRFPDLSNIRIL